MFKVSAMLLILAGSFSACWQEETKREYEEKAPCDPHNLLLQYPNSGGIPPWVYEIIDERLENGIHGKITQCEYSGGRGYLFEPLGNSIKDGYSFRACDGTVLYEGEENSEVAYSELNIKRKLLLLAISPSWEQEETSDEYLCNVINPFTLQRVKEMLYRCPIERCIKFVAITTYKDGVGFLMVEHFNTRNENWEFLDCQGNLLCQAGGSSNRLCLELDIDIKNYKIIIQTNITAYQK